MVPLLLTPGAGSDCNHASLVAIENCLLPRHVHRMNFPYRDAGKAFPDRAPVLIESICARSDAVFGAGSAVILGGRSMGGRMCSMVAAQGRLNVVALVLIGYPLHPPKKQDTSRTDHFPKLQVPCLFISGTKDVFGTPTELADATALIPALVTTHTIAGGDHSLKHQDAVVAETIAEWLRRV